MVKKADVDEFYRRLSADNPDPESELDFVNVYTLLVSVVLSAQATDVGVNKATGPLYKVVSTPQQMLKLGEAKLKDYIKTIGLYNTKAKNVIKLSQMLIESHGGEVPDDQAALEALPGVGRKTANVVRNVAFGAPTIAVDTHVFRVGNRTGLAPGKTVLDVEKKLLKVTPKAWINDAHHWLILHGRYTCLARSPKCAECKISHICTYPAKER